MSRLEQLFSQHGQSPWLDDIRRDWFAGGELAGWVQRGVRGLTSNPSIFQKAIGSGDAYDEQIEELVRRGTPLEPLYWALVADDIRHALALLRPVHDASGGRDGFVSIEVDPHLAHDTQGTLVAAHRLYEALPEPNLMVKVPGTLEGLPAIRQLASEGHSVNVTLLFSRERYAEVIEAWLSGLEACEGDLSGVHGVASFFVSRCDAAIDPKLDELGSAAAMALRGRVATANARLAYALFRERFSGPRWEALVARGAHVQRPLWASTSTKDPAYVDTLYVDGLIGPDTVNTMPADTLAAFENHGLLQRTIDASNDESRAVFHELAALGIDIQAVTDQLEREGVDKFSASFDDLMATLDQRVKAVRV